MGIREPARTNHSQKHVPDHNNITACEFPAQQEDTFLHDMSEKLWGKILIVVPTASKIHTTERRLSPKQKALSADTQQQ